MSSSSHRVGNSPNKKKEMLRYDDEEYLLRKRLPRCLPKHKNDVYVNTKTHFVGQMRRCEKLLDSGENEICIHGLGHAVNKAVHIALQLKSKYENTVIISTNTSTVELIDDFEPQTDDGEYRSQSRNNSIIHIKLSRMMPLVDIASGST